MDDLERHLARQPKLPRRSIGLFVRFRLARAGRSDGRSGVITVAEDGRARSHFIDEELSRATGVTSVIWKHCLGYTAAAHRDAQRIRAEMASAARRHAAASTELVATARSNDRSAEVRAYEDQLPKDVVRARRRAEQQRELRPVRARRSAEMDVHTALEVQLHALEAAISEHERIATTKADLQQHVLGARLAIYLRAAASTADNSVPRRIPGPDGQKADALPERYPAVLATSIPSIGGVAERAYRKAVETIAPPTLDPSAAGEYN
ncbi:hypothetical protein ACQEVI_26305 [Promicromonospora sp. CA-289599]|uniref:hypothetical protein n=1 Tax=Promicromonospora sp. CA-289599 TaxID=3240014 RepID=UPI003D8B14C3